MLEGSNEELYRRTPAARSEKPAKRGWSVMGPHNWVKAAIYCARHRRLLSVMCVPIDREIPEPLRCVPSGGGVVGGTIGPDCPCGGSIDSGELVRKVAEALRNGVGRWIQQGQVVVEY